jgi:hypothetical protein
VNRRVRHQAGPRREVGSLATPPSPARGRASWAGFLASLLIAATTQAHAKEPEIERPEPPKLDTFEVDANGDGVPDGWYNLRDCQWVAGGVDGRGSHCFRFEATKPGRPARASRAFGVDGRKVEAVVVGIWVRLEKVGPGQRMGDDPGLVVDFLGDGLRIVRRGSMGPWTKTIGPKWTRVVKRIAIPPTTRDALLSVGLIGATGVMEVDDLTLDMIPVGSSTSPNLVTNGDFELGDPAPNGWLIENGAHRAFPGHDSVAAIELAKAGSRLLTGIGVSVEGLNSLKISAAVHPRDLRGAEGATASLFYLDEEGRPLAGPDGALPVFRFGGTANWVVEQTVVPVPPGATRAVLQFEKTSGSGTLGIDDVVVTANPQPDPADWRPYHVETKGKAEWTPVEPSREVATGSGLDASALLEAPAGRYGFVTVKGGRLTFQTGPRARFFGVQLLAPAPFQDTERADALVDRLAKSGINLVRLGDLDSPLGPGRSLIDDTRDDTTAFDPIALARLDHLIARLKARGIYIALELQSARRFRPDDDVPTPELLSIGGGPAAIIDPRLRAASLKAAEALLGHVNPETGLALKDDPVLAWVTLFGEVTLFNQIDDPSSMPANLASALKTKGAGRGGWRAIESAALKEMAESLRAKGVQVPIAGVSHWRREADFSQTCAASGLDLVDDRLFWTPGTFLSPGRRSLVMSRDGGLLPGAGKKRKPDRPYVVGQFCDQTSGAWALPYEGADLMLASVTASVEDWDALVRRGYFIHPQLWGNSAPGTGGGDDLFSVAEVVNANPSVYGLLPHASSVMLRGRSEVAPVGHHRGGKGPSTGIPGWDSRVGRLVIETPFTQAVAGWSEAESARFESLTIDTNTPYCVVAVSSFTRDPIARSRRLLVTAVARVEPTGFAWVDDWRRDVADPGRTPLLREPVRARVAWRRAGTVRAFALDAEGRRIGPAPLETAGDAHQLVIDGQSTGMHWELIVE